MTINDFFRLPVLALCTLSVTAAPVDVKSLQSSNDRAAELCRKARDREDLPLYDQAQSAIDRTLKLDPGNFEAQKLTVLVLTGKHEYARGLKLAKELNQNIPDDIGVWGLLVDLNMALGDYDDAVKDAQWILNLRRNSSLGFTKAATLRETYGDLTGAMEYYQEANRRTPLSDVSEKTWLVTRMARIQRLSGQTRQAGEMLTGALQSYPESQLALAELARLRESEGNYKEAAQLFERRYGAVPSPANLYDFAQAVAKAGDRERADALFKDFESKAMAVVSQPDNANADLLFYYADRQNKPAEALKIGEQEFDVGHSFQTLDAYAWALQRNGRLKDAKTQIDRVLTAGARDPDYFCHAARIAESLGDQAGAKHYANESARLDPRGCPQ
jgi:tetratricopeptide (TPR) repeat protein